MFLLDFESLTFTSAKSRKREEANNRTPEHNSKNSSNPFKRVNKPQTQDYYASIERKKRIEQRRNRNSGNKSGSKKSSIYNEGDDQSLQLGYQNTHHFEDLNNDNKVSIDLFQQQFQSQSEEYSSDTQNLRVFDKPLVQDDFEEITQTFENGVVIQENRRTIKSPVAANPSYLPLETPTFDADYAEINENFETNDIDEEEKGINSKVTAHYLQTRNKKILFDVSHKSTRGQLKTKPANGEITSRSAAEVSADNSPKMDHVSLLEESQEVVVFQLDSKDTSMNTQRRKGSSSKFTPRVLEKQEEEKTSEEVNQQHPASQNFKRDSPGPKRETFTSSIEKKKLEDSGSMHEEIMFSDDNSDSSGVLPNTYDIKKMAPCDLRKEIDVRQLPDEVHNQRPIQVIKDENDSPLSNVKKLKVMYEELEDSGSEGSDPQMIEEANRLASIIEEEEEATEYQRSRSRTKSGSLSPVPFNMRAESSTSKIHPEEVSVQLLAQVNETEDEQKPDKQGQIPLTVPNVKVDQILNHKSEPKVTKKHDIKKSGIGKEPMKRKPRSSNKTLNRNEVKTLKNKPSPSKNSDKFESQSMKSQRVDNEPENSNNAAFKNEESVKLEHPNEDISEIKPDTKEREYRSPTNNGRIGRRHESERTMSISWHGPKHLKVIYTALQELGHEKFLDFPDFLQYYLIVNQIGNYTSEIKKLVLISENNKDSPPIITKLMQKFKKLSGKPEGNIPHFLWAFMNPDRQEYVKKKSIRDVIKACNDNKNKGRKNLLDNLEESIRNDTKDTEETQRNIRLTFNYPGTKRALISFSTTLSKIDGRISLSRDVTAFVSSCLRSHIDDGEIIFKDPIQGIERVHHEDQEDITYEKSYGEHAHTENSSVAADPDFNKKQMQRNRSNKTLEQEVNTNVLKSTPRVINSNVSDKIGAYNKSTQKLKIEYEDELFHNPSEHAISEQHIPKIDDPKVKKFNLTEDNPKRSMDSQLNRYNQRTKSKRKAMNGLDNTQNSHEWNKSLQYKMPINSSQHDANIKDSHSNAVSEGFNSNKKPNNVFAVRNNEMTRNPLFENTHKSRDKTPIAKSRHEVNFEEPSRKAAKRSKSRKNKSARTLKSIIGRPKFNTRGSKQTKVERKSRSSRKSSKKSQSAKRKVSSEAQVVDSDSEYEYVRVKKSKNKAPVIRYENESQVSSKSQDNKTFSNRRSKPTRRKIKKQRYQTSQATDSRNRSNVGLGHTPKKHRFESNEKPVSEKIPSQKRKVLFQVDINMESKVVRITIHEGDNIDRIIEKFDNIFALKPKQRSLLTQRLKKQYQEVTEK